jgi:glycine cleavage system H protein
MRHTELNSDTLMHEKQYQSLNVKYQRSDNSGKYYFLGQHSWANIDQDGVTVLGVGETFPARMGEIRAIEFPEINTFIWQGNLCVKIIAQKNQVHSVWSPLSGKVVEINHEIEKNPDLMNTDPFNDGWLVKIIPTNLASELENLTLKNI